MSGGFFRGTSADQDTRFSNKQAKLLKSQKFPPELDHLVDMTKVQLDVIKPWIASRVTDLLGFEDEVLINFIFGLLDAKLVDGKQIQIQLTGFMEKNTVKFMRELWGLLLSAQHNASGVPQQFLDAKAEEIINKKAESDRIVQEIQRKRDKEAMDQQLLDQQKAKDHKPITHHTNDKRGAGSKHGSESRERKYRKSGFDNHSPSNRKSPLASKSPSITPPRKDGRAMSRSSSPRRASRSPSLQHSISPVRRRYRSPRRSPPRRRSPYHHRRSPSPSRHRRSPHSRRRSPDLACRRTPSPARRHRSPTPPQRRPLSPSLLPPPPPTRSPQRRSLSPDRIDSPYHQSRQSLSWDAERPARGSRTNRDDYKNSRDAEKSPDHLINGRSGPRRSDAKRRGPESIAVHARDDIMGRQSSPENSPAPHSKSSGDSGYLDPSLGYKRHGHADISKSPVRHAVKQSRRRYSHDRSVEEESPTLIRGKEGTRKHMYSPSESPEERKYGTDEKSRDGFTPDDMASPHRLQSGGQIREVYHSSEKIGKEGQRKKHSSEKACESEEELKYGLEPDPVMVKIKWRSGDGLGSDEMERHGKSHEREKRRHKKSRKHRKYSDESSGQESSEESERESARRREEKRRLKREEKRQRREEKHRGRHKVAAAAALDADMREGSEEQAESESEDRQKKLEIELKERALQSFRAKKSAGTH